MIMKLLRVTKGATVNLGNYESARVEVSAEADPDGENEDTLTELTEWIDNFLTVQIRSIEDAAGVPLRDAKRFTG